MVLQAPLLNSELVNSSHLLIVQNMLSTERIEVLLSKFPLDNSSGPLLNSSSFDGVQAVNEPRDRPDMGIF